MRKQITLLTITIYRYLYILLFPITFLIYLARIEIRLLSDFLKRNNVYALLSLKN